MINALCFCDGMQLSQTFCMHVFADGCTSVSYNINLLIYSLLRNACYCCGAMQITHIVWPSGDSSVVQCSEEKTLRLV